MQPEAGEAFVRPDGRIEVICGGQWMHEEREQIAHALGHGRRAIVVRYPAIGGAFGGREDISIQIALALAAWKTGRPVKTVWSREESIIGHHKRHPFTIRAKWGAMRDGRIVAAEMDLTSDAGAYAYTSTKVLGNAVMASLGPYAIPNVKVVGRTVYTNNCPSGAFRGFGGPQGHFAAEMQVSKLAEALGMDAVELRRRNVWREGTILPTRSVVPAGCTATDVLEEAAKRMRDGDAGLAVADSIPMSLAAGGGERASGRALGDVLQERGLQPGRSRNRAAPAWSLHGGAEIERAVVACVGADVGQGAHSAFVQIAADALNIDTAQVELRAENTEDAGLQRQRFGQPHDVHGGQRHSGCGAGCAGGVANGGTTGAGGLRLPAAADDGVCAEDRRERPEHHLRLLCAGGGCRGGRGDRSCVGASGW